MRVTSRHRWRYTPYAASIVVLAVVGAVGVANSATADDGGTSDRPIFGIWEVESLNGVDNNPFFPTAGSVNTRYLRLGPARYADGRSKMVSGPNARAVSNRVFNDTNVNVFSERGVTQWGAAWGQFIDHTIGLREQNGETANIPFSSTDPLEDFENDLGVVPFIRSAAAPGTGVFNTRQHRNTVSSFIDAWAVYGGTDTRLDWLRLGSQDGNPDNNGAQLLMPGNYLPRRDDRGNPSVAPLMEVDGRLLANPNDAVVAGDVRANENAALTAIHTLMAREHNRIADALPSWISEYDRFQLARAVVIAEQQFITYTEFLPALGVNLSPYQGYNFFLNPAIAHEFASTGYRAHSMLHGEIEVETELSRYSQATLDALEDEGVEIAIDEDEVEIAVPLNVAFFNPDLVEQIQLGPFLQGLGLEPQYNNDEMIDNQLRSVLFQVPVSANPDCLDGPTLPECFDGVVDLGAVDIQRGRDHGMPSYNQMRNAYGLPSKTSFKAITGEASESFPSDPELTPGNEINDPDCLDIIALFDINGNPTTLENDDAVRVVKRCPLAARLKAIYGSVSSLDAFTGMLAEKHVSGAEFGELQLAIWKDQFRAARDGDRFFYLNDPLQSWIKQNFGIDSRKTLAEIIALNTDIPQSDLPGNVFLPDPVGTAGAEVGDGVTGADSTGTFRTPQPSHLTRHDDAVPDRVGTGGKPATIPGSSGPRSLSRRARRGTASLE